MASAVLQDMAKRIPEMDEQLKAMDELIAFMKGVGLSVANETALRNTLKEKRNIWNRQLNASGYKTGVGDYGSK
jgi:hypothetical protein